MEKVFSIFPNVRRGYFKLKEIFNKQYFSEKDIEIVSKVYKRIKLNNSITTILNCIERFSFNELSEEEMQELRQCLPYDNMDINEFRNCLAHAHYEINKNATEIRLKKGDFEYTIEDTELENIARDMINVVEEKISPQKIPFNGLELNKFLDDLMEKPGEINANAGMFATLIQSYNVYHAYLYEKVVQHKEQKNHFEYYENNILINLNLPYINQQQKMKPTEIRYESLKFEDLTEVSKADLIYFMFTSEYREDAIKYLQQDLENLKDEEIVKKIFAMYLYPIEEYKDLVLGLFKNNNDNQNENIEDIVKRYIDENITEDDYEKCNQIIEFMMIKFPKIGRIYEGNIMPITKELLHGFVKNEPDSTFIYPEFKTLVKTGTQEQCLEDFINYNEEIDAAFNSVEVSEKAIIKPTELLQYLTKTSFLDINTVTENVRMVLNEIEQAESPKDVSIIFSDIKRGKKGEDTKKDIEEFLANIPAEYKKLFVLNKCHQDYINNKPINAYRDILYLLREFGIDENHMRYKKKIEKRLGFEANKACKKDEKDRIERMLKLGKLFDKQEELIDEEDYTVYRDFTTLITHIRNSTVHAFSEAELGKLAKEPFPIRNRPFFSDERVDLGKITFNFQDYDSAKQETTFLLMNIPVEQVMTIIDMPSKYLIEREKERREKDKKAASKGPKEKGKKNEGSTNDSKSRDDEER